MEDNKNKDGFDTSGIIENTVGRRRKLTAYTPPTAPVENPPENTPDLVPETEAPETVEPVKEKDSPKEPEPPREEPRRRKPKVQAEVQDFTALFLREAAITARSGKTVYLCQEHHDRISKILHVIGKKEVSLFSYIYNVMEHHFATFREDITELYEKNIEKIF